MQVWIVTPDVIMEAFDLRVVEEDGKYQVVAAGLLGSVAVPVSSRERARAVLAKMDPTKRDAIHVVCIGVPMEGRGNVCAVEVEPEPPAAEEPPQ